MILKDFIDIQMDNMSKYSETVITDRAVPSVYDGLKPSQRKIIWSAYKHNLKSSGDFKKSLVTIGVTSAIYNHGDAALYGAICKLTTDFSKNQPLIEGHGSFETMSGDGNAAPRYTEVRLHKFSEECLLDDIRNSVRFVPTFDKLDEEPVVLAAKLPLLLINGVSGIAAGGFASSLPPHSFKSVISFTKDLIKNPDKSVSDLVRDNELYPSFPYGGLVDRHRLVEKYSMNKSTIKTKAVYHIDTEDKEYDNIVITEFPKDTKLNSIVDKIKENQSKFTGIKEVMNRTEQDKPMIVVSFAKGTNMQLAERVLMTIPGMTASESMILNFMKDDKLVEYNNIKDVVADWLQFRINTIKKSKMSKIARLQARVRILDALTVCFSEQNFDKTIDMIKNGTSKQSIKEALEKEYNFDNNQIEHIIEMKLYNINKKEADVFEKERQEKLDAIAYEMEFLKDRSKILDRINNELDEILNAKYIQRIEGYQTKYYDSSKEESVNDEDLVPDVDYLVMFTRNGYIKKVELSNGPRTQGRNGKGSAVGNLKSDDVVVDVQVLNSRDKILLFTENGYVFKESVMNIPSVKNFSVLGINMTSSVKGNKLVKVLSLRDDEYEDPNKFILVSSVGNRVKKTSLSEFKSVNKSGIIFTKLYEGDVVNSVQLVDSSKEKEVIGVSNHGGTIRTSLDKISEVKRTTYGSLLFKKDKGLEVVSFNAIPDNNGYLMVVTKNGLGKVVKVSEFKSTGTNVKGVMCVKFKTENDEVAFSDVISKEDYNGSKLLLMSKTKNIVMETKNVKESLRPAFGLSLQKLDDNDSIILGSII